MKNDAYIEKNKKKSRVTLHHRFRSFNIFNNIPKSIKNPKILFSKHNHLATEPNTYQKIFYSNAETEASANNSILKNSKDYFYNIKLTPFLLHKDDRIFTGKKISSSNFTNFMKNRNVSSRNDLDSRKKNNMVRLSFSDNSNSNNNNYDIIFNKTCGHFMTKIGKELSNLISSKKEKTVIKKVNKKYETELHHLTKSKINSLSPNKNYYKFNDDYNKDINLINNIIQEQNFDKILNNQIFRKVVFVGNNNKILFNDNALNLLSEEKKVAFEKMKNLLIKELPNNFYKNDERLKLVLPLLWSNHDNIKYILKPLKSKSKSLRSINNYFVENDKYTTDKIETNNMSKKFLEKNDSLLGENRENLGKLIKNRFTMALYRNKTIGNNFKSNFYNNKNITTENVSPNKEVDFIKENNEKNKNEKNKNEKINLLKDFHEILNKKRPNKKVKQKRKKILKKKIKKKRRRSSIDLIKIKLKNINNLLHEFQKTPSKIDLDKNSESEVIELVNKGEKLKINYSNGEFKDSSGKKMNANKVIIHVQENALDKISSKRHWSVFPDLQNIKLKEKELFKDSIDSESKSESNSSDSIEENNKNIIVNKIKAKKISFNNVNKFNENIKSKINSNNHIINKKPKSKKSFKIINKEINLQKSTNNKEINSHNKTNNNKNKEVNRYIKININNNNNKINKTEINSDNEVNNNNEINNDNEVNNIISSSNDTIDEESVDFSPADVEFSFLENIDIDYDFFGETKFNKFGNQKTEIKKIKREKNKVLYNLFAYILRKVIFKLANDIVPQKEEIIEMLSDQKFKDLVNKFKEQIIKGRKKSSLYNKSNSKEFNISDADVVDYLYRYLIDKNSAFYKAFRKIIENNKKLYNKGKIMNNELVLKKISESKANLSKLIEQFNLENQKELKNRRRSSLFSMRRSKKFYNDYSDKKIRKKTSSKKAIKINLAESDNERRISALMDEINLTNEIRYQLSLCKNNNESREKFEQLLKRIEGLKKLKVNEYVDSIKANYKYFRDEMEDILRSKAIEERVNAFYQNLINERTTIINKKRILNNQFNIIDNMFNSKLEDMMEK